MKAGYFFLVSRQLVWCRYNINKGDIVIVLIKSWGS